MTDNRAVDDCFAPTAELMPHAEAVTLLKTRLAPLGETETVPLAEACGRILARAVHAEHPVPRHTNAAVDGYAFAAADSAGGDNRLPLIDARAAAGHPLSEPVPPGSAVRILTGAVMPAGVDTVAMQEDVFVAHADDDATGATTVTLPGGLKPGANVRRAGEDVAAGACLFEAGDVLRPQDLAALASVGCGSVTCTRRVRVGVISTGDEVIRAGERKIGDGEVYDANAPMLLALARLTGTEVHDLGVWPDRRDEVIGRLEDAARQFDVLITSGGASQGEEDHVSAALDALGSRHFWRIAVKPGRPMMFGQIGKSMVVGLPGNPVAVFVCYLMYVHPMLRRLAGGAWPEPRRYALPAAFEWPKRKIGRREFWRASLREGPDGLVVEKFMRDGSGLISGLRAADGLVEVAEDVPAVMPGDLVSFIPFSEFGIL